MMHYWQKNSPLNYIQYPQIPQLHVGGYYDQEDINGPQLMYSHMEKKDSIQPELYCLGPMESWPVGQGQRQTALGKISFESNTGEWFRGLAEKMV